MQSANSSIVYTCKFGLVLLLFFPNVSSKEANLFFIVPSLDIGLIKLSGKGEILSGILKLVFYLHSH